MLPDLLGLLQGLLLHRFASDDLASDVQGIGKLRLQTSQFVRECDLRSTSFPNGLDLSAAETYIRLIFGVGFIKLENRVSGGVGSRG